MSRSHIDEPKFLMRFSRNSGMSEKAINFSIRKLHPNPLPWRILKDLIDGVPNDSFVNGLTSLATRTISVLGNSFFARLAFDQLFSFINPINEDISVHSIIENCRSRSAVISLITST
jgi:hypothetical protein